jgi:ABC-type glycerol-3-phosphate transport system substrate-binding protein
MMDFGSFPFQALSDRAPKDFKYSLMLYPKGPRGPGQGTVAWFNMVGVPAGARRPEASWAFASALGSTKAHLQQFLLQKRPSPRRDFYTAREFTEAVRAYAPYGQIQRILSAGGAYPFVRYTKVVAAVTPPLDGAFAGTMGVNDAIREAQRLGDVELRGP